MKDTTAGPGRARADRLSGRPWVVPGTQRRPGAPAGFVACAAGACGSAPACSPGSRLCPLQAPPHPGKVCGVMSTVVEPTLETGFWPWRDPRNAP